MCKPSYCRPSLLFLSPRALFCHPEPLFFVAPSEARGPSALARLGRTWWEAVAPSLLFFAAPNPPFMSPRGVSRGVPRHLRASGCQKWKRRPERSEGCLAIAQQDGVGNFFEQPQGDLGSLTNCWKESKIFCWSWELNLFGCFMVASPPF